MVSLTIVIDQTYHNFAFPICLGGLKEVIELWQTGWVPDVSLNFSLVLLLVKMPLIVQFQELARLISYRVFFIESAKVICYKRLKILLSKVVFGLRREVTMGHLMSDHFKMHF